MGAGTSSDKKSGCCLGQKGLLADHQPEIRKQLPLKAGWERQDWLERAGRDLSGVMEIFDV